MTVAILELEEHELARILTLLRQNFKKHGENISFNGENNAELGHYYRLIMKCQKVFVENFDAPDVTVSIKNIIRPEE